MRLASAIVDGERRAAILDGEVARVTGVPGLDVALREGIDLVQSVTREVPIGEVRLDAPLRPPVVFCLGLNYLDHLREQGRPEPTSEPEFFLKSGGTIAAPGDPFLLRPQVTAKLDAETELGLVLGHGNAIAGFVVINDLTARDRQIVPHAHGGFSMALGPGKNFDGATRMGPWMTTVDDVPDPQRLELTQRVNGELVQHSSTAAMIHPIGALIAYVAALLTLPAGSVIATGTPAGTGWGQDADLGGNGWTPDGCARARYLVVGDRIESAIEGVGTLEFAVADAGAATRPGATAPARSIV